MELEMTFYKGLPKGTGTELHSLRNKLLFVQDRYSF